MVGRFNFKDAMSLGSLALGKPPFLGFVLIGALGISTSEISPPVDGKRRSIILAKWGDPKGAHSHEAIFLCCVLPVFRIPAGLFLFHLVDFEIRFKKLWICLVSSWSFFV